MDRARALARAGGDETLLRELAALFLQEAPELLATIHGAIAGDDPQALTLAAHTLKGSTAFFGASDAVAAALTLEQMGRGKDLGQAATACATLEAELTRLTPGLAALVQEDAPCAS